MGKKKVEQALVEGEPEKGWKTFKPTKLPDDFPVPETVKVVKVKKGMAFSRTWHGHPVYDCPFCKFDSLSEGTIRQHIRKHNEQDPTKPSLIIKVDRFGNEVK